MHFSPFLFMYTGTSPWQHEIVTDMPALAKNTSLRWQDMFMYIFTTGAYPCQHFIVTDMLAPAHKSCMKGHILATGAFPCWHNMLADMLALTYKSFHKQILNT